MFSVERLGWDVEEAGEAGHSYIGAAPEPSFLLFQPVASLLPLT